MGGRHGSRGCGLVGGGRGRWRRFWLGLLRRLLLADGVVEPLLVHLRGEPALPGGHPQGLRGFKFGHGLLERAVAVGVVPLLGHGLLGAAEERAAAHLLSGLVPQPRKVHLLPSLHVLHPLHAFGNLELLLDLLARRLFLPVLLELHRVRLLTGLVRLDLLHLGPRLGLHERLHAGPLLRRYPLLLSPLLAVVRGDPTRRRVRVLRHPHHDELLLVTLLHSLLTLEISLDAVGKVGPVPGHLQSLSPETGEL